jgi:predicted alpha/beta superfamily hydrolase
LDRDLDKAIKEVKLLGERGEEASQKITEMEALCKKLKEDAQKLKEENTNCNTHFLHHKFFVKLEVH